MNDTPTADDILSIIAPNYKVALDMGREKQVVIRGDRVKAAMIRYAKLKVEEALKEASKKATLTKETFEFGFPGSTPDITIVDKNSILNAYPLTNIK